MSPLQQRLDGEVLTYPVQDEIWPGESGQGYVLRMSASNFWAVLSASSKCWAAPATKRLTPKMHLNWPIGLAQEYRSCHLPLRPRQMAIVYRAQRIWVMCWGAAIF